MSGHWVWCGDPDDSPIAGECREGSSLPLAARRFEEVLGRLDSIAKQLDLLSSGQRSLEHCMRHIQQDVSTSAHATPSSLAGEYCAPWGGNIAPKMGEAVNSQESLLQLQSEQALAQRRLVNHAPGGLGNSPSMPSMPAAGPLVEEELSLSGIDVNVRKAPSKLLEPVSLNEKVPEIPMESPKSVKSEGQADEPALLERRANHAMSRAGPGGFWPRKELRDLGKNSELSRISAYSAPCFTASATKMMSAAGGRWFHTLHPDSWKRAIFDACIILILLYESLMIPYQFAWHIPFEGWLAAISWITLAFWSVDFILGFVTGYHDKDRVVMDLPQIIKHYCATFFLPNLLVLTADLAANVVELTSPGEQKYNSYIKLSRIMKMNRVMRMVKMMQTGKVAHIYDLIVTIMRQWGLAEEFNFMSRVIKLVFCIMWVNHVGCCLWHVVGRSASAEWFRSSAVQDSGSGFEYLLSFYWSASSMIAGESIMVPTNSSEVALTTFFVLTGFIFSSVLISSLLTTVMEYQDSNKERAEKVKTLRQFLYQHDVDSAISVPIQKQVNYRIASQKRLSEKDVTALSLLSPVMRCELWHSIYGPSIADNAFIRTCNVLQDNFLKDICFSALQHAAHEPGYRIFEPSTEAIGPHFVYWGRLDYLPVAPTGNNTRSVRIHSGRSLSMRKTTSSALPGFSETSSLGMNNPEIQTVLQPVVQGDWVCQLSLWVHWLHRGWLEAAVPCELLTVKAEPFVKLLANKPDLIPIAKDYSAAVLGALEREPPHELSDVTCKIEHVSLVSAMPLETRVHFSWAAATVLESKQWTGRLVHQDGYMELAGEIEAGECDLVLEPDDHVYRLVTIAALRLERNNGTLLTQLGKCTKGQTIVSCTFPGTKLHIGELPQDAIDRLLRQKLQPFADAVGLCGRSVDAQEKVSKKYGVSSRYMRTLFDAEMEESAIERGIIPLTRRATSTLISTGLQKTPLEQYQAFAFAHEVEGSGTKFIYAWLSPEDNKLLTAPGGDALAQKWVSELRTDILEATPGPAVEVSELRTDILEDTPRPTVEI